METQKHDYSNFLKGLVVGGLLGGLAGIFLAPKSGKELRSDLQGKGSEALNKAKKAYEEAESRTKTFLQEAREILACTKGEAPVVNEYAQETEGEA